MTTQTEQQITTLHGGHTLALKRSLYQVVGHRQISGVGVMADREVQMVVLVETVEVGAAQAEWRKVRA